MWIILLGHSRAWRLACGEEAPPLRHSLDAEPYAPMAKLERPVQLAVIGAAHGIKGEVRVKSYTGDPLALGDYGPLADSHGRTWRIAAIRAQGANVVVRFRGVDTRPAAEALDGKPH
jgi:hypothetical protein